MARPAGALVAVLFAIDTYLVATQDLLPFDVPIALSLQQFPWGPITYIFDLTNNTAGYIQGIVGVAAVVILFIWDRRAGWLMAIGASSRRRTCCTSSLPLRVTAIPGATRCTSHG